jgi:hypothetical protein
MPFGLEYIQQPRSFYVSIVQAGQSRAQTRIEQYLFLVMSS